MWIAENAGYRLDYVVFGGLAEVVVVRLADGQVVQRCPAHRTIFNLMPAQDLEARAVAFLKKAAKEDHRTQAAASKDGTRFAERYTAVHEYISSNRYDDGSERITSTLTFFCDDGVWKASLNDRDGGRVLWVSGPSILDVLDAMEMHLRQGTGEWRQSGQAKGKKPQKRS